MTCSAGIMPFLESKPRLHYMITKRGLASPPAFSGCAAKGSEKHWASGSGLFPVCVHGMAVGGSSGVWGVEKHRASTFPPTRTRKLPSSPESCKPHPALEREPCWPGHPCTSPSRISSRYHFVSLCSLPNALLLFLIGDIIMHLTTLNPAPRPKPPGTTFSCLLSRWASLTPLHGNTQIILTDAIGFSLLFGNCFSLSRKCGRMAFRVSEYRATFSCQPVFVGCLFCQARMRMSDAGNSPKRTKEGRGRERRSGALQF